jgi:oligopeptide/dipeptide ABC transporter ATP-binding protein
MTRPLLELKNLRVALGREHRLEVIRGVSFDVAPGQIVGLVGESGSGKTTIANAIFGFLGEADIEGSVNLDGTNLLQLSDSEMRPLRGSALGWVAQDPLAALNPSHRVGRQVAEAITVHTAASRAEVRTRVLTLLSECGLPEPERLARQYPHTLSGGMRQRVAIAIAIACNPSILIADEPTTSLDNRVQAQVLDLLAELRRRHGMSMILISHDLGVVAQLADILVVLYAGQVVEFGPAEIVLGAPRHPYTQALLNARPRLRGPRRGKFETIRGAAPRPGELSEGCSFRQRCPIAAAICVTPPDLEHRGGHRPHLDRCWKSGEAASIRGRA